MTNPAECDTLYASARVEQRRSGMGIHQVGDTVLVALGPNNTMRKGAVDAFLPGDEWVRVLLDKPWPDKENRLVNVPITKIAVLTGRADN